MVFTEQQLQVKKLVDVQQDIEIDALNDGVGALSSTMQNGFTEAANNFYDIHNSLESMNTLSNERYNGVTGSVNTLSNAMTQGFLDMGNTVANVTGEIQGQLNQMNANTGNMNNNIQNQFNGVNIELQNIQNNFELVNTNIGESINAYNDQITNSLSVDTLSANTLIYNISEEPVSSLTALGYDSNGRVIPVTVIANQNVVLPENANYLYTDSVGTPYAGMADTSVSTNENLITSHAVYNAVNDVWADLNGLHNEVSNSFSDVQNSFNDVNNSINNMNSGIQNQFNGVQNSFNNVNNSFGESNTILSLLLGFHSIEIINLYPTNYYNSNIVGYQNLTEVVFVKNTDVVGTSYGNTVLNFNTQTNILTIGTPFGVPTTGFNKNMRLVFQNCTSFNQNIQIPDGIKDITGLFAGCSSLNQNIKIPNSVKNLCFDSSFPLGAFRGCTSLNQNIVIPENVNMMPMAFRDCTNLNHDIYIYSDKIYAKRGGLFRAFNNCPLLANRNIHIRSTIPMETSNDIYNALVNNNTGINWSGRILNTIYDDYNY